jgi:hypothetical protein
MEIPDDVVCERQLSGLVQLERSMEFFRYAWPSSGESHVHLDDSAIDNAVRSVLTIPSASSSAC